MKSRFSTLYHHVLKILVALLLTALGMTAIASHYQSYQKSQLNKLALQKLTTKEQEIFVIKNRISKFKQHSDDTSKEILDEQTPLSAIDFENQVKKDLARFKYQAVIKKISLPNDAFLIFEQKYFLTKNTEKELQLEQKKWFLTKYIFEKILDFPKSKIEKFELKEEWNNNHSPPTLGQFVISITMREDKFHNLFNAILKNNALIISQAIISNINPLPPLHHCVYSKDRLVPILGNETITAILQINLVDTNPNIAFSSNVEWHNPKQESLLFVSRHYAVKNEVLIDPIEYPQIINPPVPNQWLVCNNLDYSNPNVLFEDIDHTGFNNLEKWQGDNPQEEPGKFSSDPNDPTSHPLLWTKLRCHQKDITSETYSIYFLGFQSNKKEKLFQIQPNTPLQTKSLDGKAIFNKKIRYAKMGEQIEGLPYKIVSYQEKQSHYKKTSYDSSELTLENLDTKEQIALVKKTPYNPQPTQLTNVTSIKIENLIFNPSEMIDLKLGDHFSLAYVLPNEGSRNNQNTIDQENYQLVNISNNGNFLTIKKDSNEYKIPITSIKK